ncbi:hypothetical protein [Haloarcula salinisoli]|uniref:Protein-glutamine gamma-glutamyltransferase-like C-terminal domain-containing protein n=1 Tax=Haloarcula salinisoli TaxID=2487746 RepID=A0A8J7YMN4_9EURY|nr:hypothetical protein [Halomicroarcula salinisoli]MBX0304551.1 hypothetical protein [Halomicroarcula salinisoli]
MSGTDPFDDVSPGREPLRAGLALVCILAVVFAAAALPTLSLAGGVESVGPESVPFGGSSDGAGAEPGSGEGNVTPGDGRLTPDEQLERSSQRSGATPTGSLDDAAGNGTGEQASGGAAGNRPGDSDTSGQASGGETGNRTSGENVGQTDSSDDTGGEGGSETVNQTGDGDTGDQAGDGDTGDQAGDGNTGDQTSDGDTGDQTSDGDTGDQTGDGDTGDQTSDGDTGDQTGDGDTGGRTGDGDTGDQTGDGDTGDQTSDSSTGDETSDGDTGDQTGDGDTGDQTGDGDTRDQTSDGSTGDETSDGETVDDTETDSYNVTLNRSATAGAVVEVTVTRDGEPAGGVQVSFNGDPIGTTDEAGTVVGRVPYEDQLNITLESGTQQSLSAPPRPRGDRLFALSAPPPAQVENESFTVNTNVSVSLSGPVVTGQNVTLTATIDGVPVRSAAVTIDGERVATTDGSGTATVSLPAEPGNYTIGVSRDAVNGTRTVTLDGLGVETEPTLPLALPGTGLAVTVTAGGEPVPNATVVLDGEAVAETDGNGTARLTLPFAGSATVTVRQYGQRSEAVVGGLFVNLAGVLVGALALAGGAGYLLRRRGVSRATVTAWLRRATQLAVNSLLWLAAALDGALGRLRARIVLTVAALRAFLTRRRTPAALWAALRAWAVAKVAAARASADAAATAARNADPRIDERDPADDRTTIRAAWGRLVEHVSLRRTDTATPGEIAAHAVEADDLPAEAVGVLREAYRAVEYGQYDPGDHVTAVERAIETIERSVEADAGAEDGGDAA